MKRLTFRPRAIGDLDEIWTYTAARRGTGQAEVYLRSIRDGCAALAAGDLSGSDASDLRPAYRKLPIGRHIVFFRPHPDTIEVVRVLHERMDARARL